jgi:hypothetical protein
MAPTLSAPADLTTISKAAAEIGGEGILLVRGPRLARLLPRATLPLMRAI